MAWDDDYDEDYFLGDDDELDLIDVGPVGEFFSDRLREELDYELYEQEREEADGDDFPESFEEWKIMKFHLDIGARIIQRIPFLQECMPVVHYHHERWDGSGYPFGLEGQDIPIQARIFAVADVFDALTSKRSYRKTSTPDDAVEYLREQANILFDPEIVETLAKLPYAEFIQKEKTIPNEKQ